MCQSVCHQLVRWRGCCHRSVSWLMSDFPCYSLRQAVSQNQSFSQLVSQLVSHLASEVACQSLMEAKRTRKSTQVNTSFRLPFRLSSVDARFSPFGHPTQVDTSQLYMCGIDDFLWLAWTFEPTCESVWPPIVSPCVSSGSQTCVDLRRLASPFGDQCSVFVS